ncbi:MAG: hypothetical protein ABSC53_15795, partial [Bacteroidota bacterium]
LIWPCESAVLQGSLGPTPRLRWHRTPQFEPTAVPLSPSAIPLISTAPGRTRTSRSIYWLPV